MHLPPCIVFSFVLIEKGIVLLNCWICFMPYSLYIRYEVTATRHVIFSSGKTCCNLDSVNILMSMILQGFDFHSIWSQQIQNDLSQF